MKWFAAQGVALSVALAPLSAQTPPIRGYYLHVAVVADSGPFSPPGVLDLQRVRFMAAPVFGPIALDVAYEHAVEYMSRAGAASLASGLGQATGGNDWLPLQGTLRSSHHVEWRHRIDRLSIRYATKAVELTAGRQPISWATTLLLTPADPFLPFDPSDPFREYRTGVDAARLRTFPGPFTEIEAVVRPADTPVGKTLTALARGRTSVGHWDLAAWGGALQDDAAFGLSVTRTVAGAALRAEGVVRRSGGATITRVAAGVDRSFNLAGRTLYIVAEYQRDGFGAASAARLSAVLASQAFARSELQVLGRDEAALQLSYQVHPLVTLDALSLWNLDDDSVLMAPGASYSIVSDITLRAGIYNGLGHGVTTSGRPGSEYGAVPLIGYLALTAFF